jgi:ribosomal protein L7/L12
MAGATRAVFLSYRREETRHIAGRLADRLTDRLGSTQVFMDVDTIEPGTDFAAAIAREVASCDVLIALIGPIWSTIVNRWGRRRLDDPDDFVVFEIRAALEREIHIIPVLVDGAVMPDRHDLPEGLQCLARRNAVRLDHETFRSDVAVLLNAVDRILSTPAQKATEPRVGAGVPAIGEKDEFNVVLEVVGNKKIEVIKVVREIVRGLGLKEAKDLVESAPKPVLSAVPKNQAEAAKAKLEGAGAKVSLT